MSLSHTLLGLLSYEPMTGYQLKQVFESSINHFWHAHMSQIYRELGQMETKGWVSYQIEPQEGKPDKKIYSITDEGRKNFTRWLKDFPENPESPHKNEFLARIFFASNMDLSDLAFEFKRYLRKQQEQLEFYQNLENVNKEHHAHGDSDTPFWHMALRLGIKSTESAIDWAQECLETIHSMEQKKQTPAAPK
ncbi:MAG: hypothetical protein H6Q67_942 [Firmicutes bacterium]|nr:hypothetical protein [Bacillota bacterium]